MENFHPTPLLSLLIGRLQEALRVCPAAGVGGGATALPSIALRLRNSRRIAGLPLSLFFYQRSDGHFLNFHSIVFFFFIHCHGGAEWLCLLGIAIAAQLRLVHI